MKDLFFKWGYNKSDLYQVPNLYQQSHLIVLIWNTIPTVLKERLFRTFLQLKNWKEIMISSFSIFQQWIFYVTDNSVGNGRTTSSFLYIYIPTCWNYLSPCQTISQCLYLTWHILQMQNWRPSVYFLIHARPRTCKKTS